VLHLGYFINILVSFWVHGLFVLCCPLEVSHDYETWLIKWLSNGHMCVVCGPEAFVSLRYCRAPSSSAKHPAVHHIEDVLSSWILNFRAVWGRAPSSSGKIISMLLWILTENNKVTYKIIQETGDTIGSKCDFLKWKEKLLKKF
jgi:hypothetical protein